MRDFKSRRNKGLLRVLTGGFLLAALAAMAVISSRAAWEMYTRFADASVAAAAAQGELKALQAQFASTTAEVESLNTARGEEEALRERYGVARPGEGEITIVREKDEADAPAGEEGFFLRIWHALFVW